MKKSKVGPLTNLDKRSVLPLPCINQNSAFITFLYRKNLCGKCLSKSSGSSRRKVLIFKGNGEAIFQEQEEWARRDGERSHIQRKN